VRWLLPSADHFGYH